MTTHRLLRAALGVGAAVLALSLGGCGEDLEDEVTQANCGSANQECCGGATCFHGAACAADNRCRAPTNRPTNECRSADECASNGVCGGTFDCSGGRACFLCESERLNASVPFGGRCTSSADCLTNVCIMGRCTVPCRHGAAGDTLCRGQGGASRYEFCATMSGVLQGMPMGPQTTLSFCVSRCQDGVAECPTGFQCLPREDGLHTRNYGACLVPPMSNGP